MDSGKPVGEPRISVPHWPPIPMVLRNMLKLTELPNLSQLPMVLLTNQLTAEAGRQYQEQLLQRDFNATFYRWVAMTRLPMPMPIIFISPTVLMPLPDMTGHHLAHIVHFPHQRGLQRLS